MPPLKPSSASRASSARAEPLFPNFIATKLQPPVARPGLIARPRLLHLLRDTARAPLTLLAAPAGFGKTTLLAEWHATLAAPCAWVALDPYDNDPIRFWRYILAALDAIHPGAAADGLALLQAPQPPPAETLVAVLARACAAVAQPFYLVLDDYHVIERPEIHARLADVLQALPPHARLVIASRMDPPLPLARLRARGQLIEIRASELRFEPGEAAAFLSATMGLHLRDDQIATLEQRTEGWAAGLQLAALSLRGRQDVDVFLHAFTGSHRLVLDYLSDEVLARQPETVRTFLEQTAILDRLSAPLCDAVTESSGSQRMLEALEHANLFLIPLDDERVWYRYHHLFAEVLRAQARTQDPEQLAALHRRAAQWFAANDLPGPAVRQAVAARDYPLAARVIQPRTYDLLARHGDLTTLLGWIRLLPPAFVRTQPALCLAQAWALVLAGPHQELPTWLEAAQQAIAADPEPVEAAEYAGELQALYALISSLGQDVAQTLTFAEAAEQAITNQTIFPWAIAAYARGIALYFGGDFAAARDSLSDAIERSAASGSTYTHLVATSVLGYVQVHAGLLGEAEVACRRAMALGTTPGGLPLPMAAYAYTMLSEALAHRLALDEALRLANDAIRIGRESASVDFLCLGYAALALVQLARQDYAATEEALRVCDDLFTQMRPAMSTILAETCRVRLWLAQGRMAAIERWQRALADAPPTGDAPYTREERAIVALHARLAQGAAAEVDAAAADLIASASASGHGLTLIEGHLLRALAQQHLGQPAEAARSLSQALVAAEPEGHLLPFTLAGDALVPLLRRLRPARADDGIAVATPSPAFIAQVLRALAPASPAGTASQLPASAAPARAPTVPPTLLTAREHEVLREIAAGRSNAEIASDLVVEVSTVKRHVNAIFSKLQAVSRTQAVARARSLGLLA